MVSVRGPNRNLLMGVASPQREKSCVAPSTDARSPSLARSEGGEEAEEGACYFGSLDGEDVKRIPGFRRSAFARWALLCELLEVGWIGCDEKRL